MILQVYIWTQLKICLASFARGTDTAKDPVTFSVRVDIDSARHIASVQPQILSNKDMKGGVQEAL